MAETEMKQNMSLSLKIIQQELQNEIKTNNNPSINTCLPPFGGVGEENL
jgi:hypothetical protein